MSSGVSFAEASVMRGINAHLDEMVKAVTSCLARTLQSYSGLSIVCGLWTADSLRESLANAVPIFYADAGTRGTHLYDDVDCLATNARYKASACAQSGFDTLVMQNDPAQWLSVEGPYYPWGGAIIRRIGPVEFVISTSGLDTGTQDHIVSEVDVLPLVKAFTAKINAQNLIDTDREPSDPKYRKYLVGSLGEAQTSNASRRPSSGLV